MTDTVIDYRFVVRRGTAAALAAANETPLQGEFYLETDTKKLKLGDGVTAYNSLPYFASTSMPAVMARIALRVR